MSKEKRDIAFALFWGGLFVLIVVVLMGCVGFATAQKVYVSGFVAAVFTLLGAYLWSQS